MILKRMYYAVIRVLTEKYSDPEIVSLLRQYREAQDRYAARITIYATPLFNNMYPGAEERMDWSKEECAELRDACKKSGARDIQLRAFGFIYYGSGGAMDVTWFF